MYRQHLGDLSIEEGSATVPADGRYHVIRAGKIVRSFKTLKGARALYITLRTTAASAAAESSDGPAPEAVTAD